MVTGTFTRTHTKVVLVVVHDWHGVEVYPYTDPQVAMASAREIAGQRVEDGSQVVDVTVPGTLLVLNYSADSEDKVWVEEARVDPPPGDVRCDCRT